MTPNQPLKIGDVARLTGLSVDTVRFYEKEGLLGRVRRVRSIRFYDEAMVKRLDFVRKAVGLGFSLSEIRSLLALRVSSRTSCDTLRDRALLKVADIETRMDQLAQMRDALLRLATTCSTREASTPCPFLDAMDLPAAPPRTRRPTMESERA